jgi:glycosyltransferase involved in cell wall biosynthesis
MSPRLARWRTRFGLPDARTTDAATHREKTRIVGLVSPLPPQLGGVVTVARWLLDHESDVGCCYVPFDLVRPTEEAGGRLRVNTFRDQLRLLMRFLRWTRRAPSVIHCMVSPTLLGLSRDALYLALLTFSGRRTVAHVHIVRPDVSWWRLTMRVVGKLATEVVVLGAAGRTALEDLGVQAHVIPNAIPFPVDVLPADANTIGPGPFRILFVGTFGERKGCHELIKAMAALRDEGLNCRLEIIGREEYAGEESRLRSEVDANHLNGAVRFLGQRGPDELASLYRGSDAFCLPSHLEGLPLALIEAMAYGLPAVATPVGCVEDLVIDGETGLLAEAGDPTSLSKQLGRLIRDPELGIRLGRTGARHVAVHMGSEVVAAAWREVYTSATA